MQTIKAVHLLAERDICIFLLLRLLNTKWIWSYTEWKRLNPVIARLSVSELCSFSYWIGITCYRVSGRSGRICCLSDKALRFKQSVMAGQNAPFTHVKQAQEGEWCVGVMGDRWDSLQLQWRTLLVLPCTEWWQCQTLIQWMSRPTREDVVLLTNFLVAG